METKKERIEIIAERFDNIIEVFRINKKLSEEEIIELMEGYIRFKNKCNGERSENKQVDYETNCVICGKKFITTTHTANEGMCIKCREC